MVDVAATAGVSLKSVSRVINNEPHVSARLRAKVEAAIAALDYEPDPAARSLAGARVPAVSGDGGLRIPAGHPGGAEAGRLHGDAGRAAGGGVERPAGSPTVLT